MHVQTYERDQIYRTPVGSAGGPKNKLDFSNYLIFKEFLECIAYISSYLPKLNCDLELLFGAPFLHIFFMEIFIIFLATSSWPLLFFIKNSIKRNWGGKQK